MTYKNCTVTVCSIVCHERKYDMKLGGFYLVVCATIVAASCQPAHASKARELTEVCKENPTHQVCVDLAAKKAKAKARADAKLQGLIDQVKEK